MEEDAGISRRETPKINGSVGAFVAVIVCLILVILACSGAIFYLIREQRRHEAQRVRSRKRRLYQDPPAAPIPTQETDGTIGVWRDKLSSLFPANPFGSTRSREAARGHGWTQAGSVDDWDVEIGEYDSRHDRPSILQTPSKSLPPRGGTDTPVSRSNTASTANSVRFELPAIHVMSNSDLKALQAPNILSQFSSPPTSRPTTPMHVRTLSPEPMSPHTPDHPARISTPSSLPPRHSSSSSGTKFIEIL